VNQLLQSPGRDAPLPADDERRTRCYDDAQMELTERPITLVSLTERAASKITELMAEEPEGEAAVLRVAVQGGGCSGFEYALGFDRGAMEGDHEVELEGVRVVVDPYSAPYLQGTEIDFVEGLQGGFAINNPNVTASCGCGHSFQVAEGEDPAAAAGDGCGSGCSH
jgi:iron-sulfur cluster assembly protein